MSTNMAFAPSPPPCSQSSNDNTVIVEAVVIVAIVFMFLFHILGSLRRLSSHSLLHSIVMGIDTLSYPLVTYAIGSIKSSEWIYKDFAVWAVFLLLLLGNTDSLTVCRLNDIDNWKAIYVKHLFKGFMVVLIVMVISHAKFEPDRQKLPYRHTLYAILLVVILKGYVRVASMRMVSKTYLGKEVKVIAEYMQHKENQQVKTFGPVTMEGYRYMVAGEKYCVNRSGSRPWYMDDSFWKDITTVENIWKCVGNLLNDDRGKVLKDVCLSMALSKMLNRRFAGFKLSEADHEKTHDFVFKGLLAGDKQPHQRAFRVIEDELVFVHDLYYTRYYYLYQKGRYLALCLPVVMLALCSWLTFLLVKNHERRPVRDATIFITVVLVFLEAYQLYLYIASGWFKVALIRSYVTITMQKRGCYFLDNIMGLLLRLKAYRPWKGRLGQYCILRELGQKSKVRNCLHYATFRLVDKARMKGRKNSSFELSENVKQAIVDSLLGSNGHLTNGLASLQKNGLHDHLILRACDTTATDGAVTRTILVWHIATTICYHQLDEQAKKIVGDTVETASTLSQYCLHLLAFAPNLLPDHSSISESLLDQVINKAEDEIGKAAKDKKMKDKDIVKSRCQILMENMSTHDRVSDETRLVAKGVQLARHLIEDIQEPTLRWKVLSDFWAEMMLYVSPSDNAREHLETLAKGGEFITHLWALLTHAGVLSEALPGQTMSSDLSNQCTYTFV